MTELDRRRIEAGVEPARTSQGERYAMNENSNVVRLRHADEIDDPLTNILRSGARRLLAQAVCQRRSKNASVCRSKNTSVTLAKSPRTGGLFVGHQASVGWSA